MPSGQSAWTFNSAFAMAISSLSVFTGLLMKVILGLGQNFRCVCQTHPTSLPDKAAPGIRIAQSGAVRPGHLLAAQRRARPASIPQQTSTFWARTSAQEDQAAHEASGNTPKHLVNPCPQKHSTFPNFGFMAYTAHPGPCQRGASRSSRDAGRACGGRGSAGATCMMTGRATVSPQATRYDPARSQRSGWTSGASTRQPLTIRPGRPRTEKSCGPDARGLCVKSQR